MYWKAYACTDNAHSSLFSSLPATAPVTLDLRVRDGKELIKCTPGKLNFSPKTKYGKAEDVELEVRDSAQKDVQSPYWGNGARFFAEDLHDAETYNLELVAVPDFEMFDSGADKAEKLKGRGQFPDVEAGQKGKVGDWKGKPVTEDDWTAAYVAYSDLRRLWKDTGEYGGLYKKFVP